MLEDAVATQDTVTPSAATRRVRQEVAGAVEVVAPHCTAHPVGWPPTGT